MAPSRSQPPSSQKKQQSISSFFTSKPASTPKPSATKLPIPSSPSPNDRAANGDALFVGSDEEEEVPQRRISRQSKRTLDEDDGSDIENGAPGRKKLKALDEGADEGTLEASASEEISRAEEHPVPREHRQSLGQASSAGLNSARGPKVSARTSKYIFSSSPPQDENQVEPDTDEVRRHKERLHQRFVKKLGKPDSIAEIKRRNHFITEETADGEPDAEDEEAEEEEPPPKAAKGRKGAAAKASKSKLTPMEKQVLDLKRKHMDALLVVEVGYKFRFFGEDARIAAKQLGIVCIPGKFRYDEHPSEAHIDRFASASFPTHRLHVHVKRLVQAGHKVGVVRQLETAALKAVGDNRNAPFVRKLTNLYTKGTYIDDVEGLEGPVAGPAGGAPSTGYLLCLTETNAKGWGTDEKVHVGIVAVQPATGDIIYDDFEDGFMRSEIETRLLHIAPCEFLVVGDLSKATEKLVQHLSASKTNVFGDAARVERVEKPKTMAAQAYSHISNFYAEKMKSGSNGSDQQGASNVLDRAHQLSEHVTVCLSAMITHLSEYGLEHVFDLTKNFQPFSARSHMLLNGNTLTSLEIYRNQTDYTEKGSLFWTLDRTRTRFGQRLLRKWVGRPLLDKAKLEARIAAVEELNEGERTMPVDKLKHVLSLAKGDFEKSLIRIYYKKCARPELLGFLQTLQRISSEYAHVKTPSEADAIASLPQISTSVLDYLERINPQAAKDDDKYAFFRDEYETEPITEHKLAIASIEDSLNEHRATAAAKLRKKKVDYVTVNAIEYLIEVDNTQLKNVPASWQKISGTKKLSRFHTPEVVKLLRERDQHKEALAAACDAAFSALLAEIGTKYQALRDCIQSLATLDALLSLADVSAQPGYTKPVFADEPVIDVKAGRHPMVERLLLDAYVPNDPALLITGPNMGGKSSYVRQVALIAIMAQIGCYVPAESARLGLLDAVFTRMGAFDNMMKGESTFMVELSETADLLKQATPRSLVILDELGRGTSTHDGVAIAEAVLEYLVSVVKCLTLFITHYQSLARLSGSFPDGRLRNVHMRFEESGTEGEEVVTFLYEVAEGVAHRSYGLNVARLANVPRSVVEVARVKSGEMEEGMRRRRLANLARIMGRLGEDGSADALDVLVSGIEQL
ncbi:Mismatch repair protein msh3 [Coniosporium tulheliwenetii]|uniref:Mismatch repair protein msh3 n=1 Tax=Coniosporium tulheliwenetii TaxID=3383036 RepID=A0ACC2ZD23_9PEZI|nr:Mismatch repair protein msh3 [Cladosporium sp. JES 115]